jgi:putative phosphoribosyl transferase
LRAALEVIVVRKLGVPWQPELAMGAIAGSVVLLDEPLVRELEITAEDVERVVSIEKIQVQHREQLFRNGRQAPDLAGRDVILVDDGLATGSTMLAAVQYVRTLLPARVTVAVPVGSRQACALLRREAGTCICLATPEPFSAVGEWYSDFQQVSNEEVRGFLAHVIT